MTSKPFSELGLSPEILKAIDRLGFEQASPIQAAAIPSLLAGLDIVGQSQTGSGKTAAFAIPAIEKTDPNLRAVQVLILCPTRELAVQVAEEFHKLALFKRGVQSLPIYGGQSYERQFNGLRQGAQIVIGTPGRVMDHLRRGTLRLDQVKMAILDEADVMLNMGFRDDIEFILQAAPKQRQTVFFSATMPRPIRDLIEKYARQPQNVQIEQKAMTVPTVEQVYYEVDRRFKLELLTRLIDVHDLKLGIIFCNTKRMVDELAEHLEAQGYMADCLHGDMSQAMRDRVMNKFRKSGLEFLVATDIAARGIDVDDVQVVFNYDLPYDGEDYVHRIGRTGRAGREGRAISFVSGRELFQIRNIERYTNTRIHRGRIPTAEDVEGARENLFLAKLRALLQSGDFRRNEPLVERFLEEGFASTDVAAACLTMLQGSEGTGRQGSDESNSRSEREERPQRPPPGWRPDSRTREDSRRTPGVAKANTSPLPGSPPVTTPKSAVGTEKVAATEPAIAAAAPSPITLPNQSSRPEPTPKPARADSIPAPTPVSPITSLPDKVQPSAPAISPTTTASSVTFPSQAPKKHNPPHRPASAPVAKPSRALATNQTRLWMNLGETMSIKPIDIAHAIAGETGLPESVVGNVDIRERHLFVDVAAEHAPGIIAKLNRSQIRGQKVKVKLA